MKNTIYFIFIFCLFSCGTAKNDYLILNTVLNKKVAQSNINKIGFITNFYNHRFNAIEHKGNSKILNDILMTYNKKLFFKCSKSIKNEIFKKFNINEYKKIKGKWNVSKIKNDSVVTLFTFKRDKNIQLYNEMLKTSKNKKAAKLELSAYFWGREQHAAITHISTPIYTNDKKNALLYVYTNQRGLNMWLLKKVKKKWVVDCIEGLTIE